MKKKLVSTLLVLAMIVTMIPTTTMITFADTATNKCVVIVTGTEHGSVTCDGKSVENTTINGTPGTSYTVVAVSNSGYIAKVSLDGTIISDWSHPEFLEVAPQENGTVKYSVRLPDAFPDTTLKFEFEKYRTPIESVDVITNYNIGVGWAGKTASSILQKYNNYNNDKYTLESVEVLKANLDPIGDNELSEGAAYVMKYILRAKEDYTFNVRFNQNNVTYDYSGEYNDETNSNILFNIAKGGSTFGWTPITDYINDDTYISILCEFTATGTPIEEIDLSGYDIGNGWAGKTSEEIANIFKGYNMCNCTYFDSIITDDENKSVDTPLKEGTPYLFVLVLKANDNYCFNKEGEKNLDGEVILADKNKSIFNAAGVGTWDSQSRRVYVEGNKNVVISFNITPTSESKDKVPAIIKIGIVAAAVAAVAGVVATAVKNVQKAAVAQQMAFQAKMQQKMVQKQVASIKTVLKGAGVVFSLANFGSSLGKLFQLNQFGFNQFGFR